VKGPNKDKLKSCDKKRRRFQQVYLQENNKYCRCWTNSSVVFSRPKGELGGPGKFVNQDRLVANAQGSSSLNYYWPSRHEGFGFGTT